jgi:hypothetical protein
MCEACDVRIQEIQRLERKTGHKGLQISEGVADRIRCSCGWESNGYWDGMEWATDEFAQHLKGVE